jgi:NAD(P)-dependent dehydrogenase (short-subunit alcohol dehydrogenase family)
MEERFTGKVAIVTGAGSGIGRAVAMRLAREGAEVVAVDIDEQAILDTLSKMESSGLRFLPYTIDLQNIQQIPVMLHKTVEEFGRLDILVNSAGVAQTKPLLEITAQDWDRIVDINQKGLFFCIQAAGAQMIQQIPSDVREAGISERSYGKIVNLSSISGRRGRALQTPYAASKAAIISITQSAALAFAPYNINVNAIAPSIVLTPMWEQIDRDRSSLSGLPAGKVLTDFIERIPLKRPATVEDIAAAVSFLCSSDADYITGQCLNVDGGFEMD